MGTAHRKGYSFEKQILDYLKEELFPDIYRPRAGTHEDIGDFGATDEWVFQCKNHKSLNLSGWVREAQEQAENKHSPRYAVIHKRRGVGEASLQYCTFPLHIVVDLIKENKILKGEMNG